METDDTRQLAAALAIAEQAVDVFSRLHPHVRLNVAEWMDLRECIEREVRNQFGEKDVSAMDLLSDDAS